VIGDSLLVDGVDVAFVFVLIEMDVAKEVNGDEVKVAEISAGCGDLIADSCTEVKSPNLGEHLRPEGAGVELLGRGSKSGVVDCPHGFVVDVQLLSKLQIGLSLEGQREALAEDFFAKTFAV